MSFVNKDKILFFYQQFNFLFQRLAKSGLTTRHSINKQEKNLLLLKQFKIFGKNY